jgi:hypothetical protein
LPPERSLFVRLEDLQESAHNVRQLFHFLGLEYAAEHFAAFRRPHNVNRPEDERLTPQQADRFAAVAGEMMSILGYAEMPEYVVNY